MESRATHCSWLMAFISRSASRRSFDNDTRSINLPQTIPAVRQNRSTCSRFLPCLSMPDAAIPADAILLHGVAFLLRIRHPEPTGSRRATPISLFQHAGTFPSQTWKEFHPTVDWHSHGKPCGTEERVYTALQGADHGPDAPSLNQPAARAWFPLAAGAAHECVVILRAAHRDPTAERAEFDGADPRWDG